MRFSVEMAASLAELPMHGIGREYPNHTGHVLHGPEDVKSPRELHPAFYGCFDWHSAVHSHWTLIHILRRFPHVNAERIRALLGGNLTEQNLQAEFRYFSEPNRQSYERPYGWAWLLQLALELRTWDDADGRLRAEALLPLEALIAARFQEFLPRQEYAIRTGMHSNTAFSLSMVRDYAIGVRNTRLLDVIDERSRTYYGRDAGYLSGQEPSGADFLSPCLAEADLLRRVLPPDEFQCWFHRYLPEIGEGRAAALLTPVEVSDRRDPQIGHLDGLNLSRAWCLAGIASVLPKHDPITEILSAAAQRHAAKGLSHVATGDYAGEHWLASFAIYLLSTFESLTPCRVE